MDITEMPNTSKHASEGKSWSPWSLQEGMAGDAGGGAAPGTHNEDSTCLHEPSSQHLPQPTANGEVHLSSFTLAMPEGGTKASPCARERG